MAQIVFEIGSDLTKFQRDRLLGPEGLLPQTVNRIHYGTDKLSPGDITMAVSKGVGQLSVVTVSEGSSNWPVDSNGNLYPPGEMRSCGLALREAVIANGLGDDRDMVQIHETNGVCPDYLPGGGKNEGIIVIARDFENGEVDSQKLKNPTLYDIIMAALRGADMPQIDDIEYRLPTIIPDLSTSSAGTELEVVLPHVLGSTCFETDQLAQFASTIGGELGHILDKPTNCFAQAPTSTGWYKAA